MATDLRRVEEIDVPQTIDLTEPPARPPLGSAYLRLWLATAVSNIGDGVRIAALPLLAASFTRDPLLISGVLFASNLPWLLFSLLSGAVVDRVDRRRLMIRVAVLRGVVMALLGLSLMFDIGALPVVYVVAVLLGIGEVFADNASFALLPKVVPRERLDDANGRLEAAIVVTNEFIGPALGGLLFAVAIAAPFTLDALTFVAAAALIASLRNTSGDVEEEPSSGRSIRAEIAEGIRWLRGHTLLLNLSLIAAATNFVLHAAFAIQVLFALEILHSGEVGFGLLLSVEALGALVGALLAGSIRNRLGTRGTVVMALTVAGVANLAVAFTSEWAVAALMMAAVSFGGGLWSVVTSSLRQRLVPDRLMGRVQSTHRLLAWGAVPLGAFAGGISAKLFGLRSPFLLAAIVLLVVAVAAARSLRSTAA
jgi:MFS family permease